MAEKRKTKQKKKDKKGSDDFAPTKEEYAVGKFLRFNVPVKQTTVMGNEVNYFTGSKAVDMLLDSKWATGKAKQEPLFTTRESCVHYLQTLLQKEFFYRARRLVQRPRDKDKEAVAAASKAVVKAKETEKGEKKSPRVTKESKAEPVEPPKEAKKDEEKDPEEKEKPTDDKEKDTTDASKKKKKIKLEIHPDPTFVDGSDVYVWVYDPTPLKTWLLGSVIVVGSILICLFPLWPPEVRNGVYYLSMSAMGFVGVIVALIVLRSILFGLVWMTTMGRHHFWLLPNLTEDCGFFESFKPTYSHKFFPKVEPEGNKEEKSDSSGAVQEVVDDNDPVKADEPEIKATEEGEDLSDKSEKTDTDRESDEEKGEDKDATEPKKKRRGSKESGSSSSHESNNDFELVDTPAANQ